VATVKGALDSLTQASHKLAQVMYESAGAAAGGQAPPPEGGAGKAKDGEDVIDAEYEDA